MRGRFANDLTVDVMRDLFGASGAVPSIRPSYNIGPFQHAPVIVGDPKTGERSLQVLRWGLMPAWASKSIHKTIIARDDTLAVSKRFRDAYAYRRCIVPARCFYEWQSSAPYAFRRVDGAPMALAGIWESWSNAGQVIRTFAIITTSANKLVAPIHDRMLVVLEPEDWAVWLSEQAGDVAALLRPASEGVLECWRVASRVTLLRNDNPALLDPVEPPHALPVESDEERLQPDPTWIELPKQASVNEEHPT